MMNGATTFLLAFRKVTCSSHLPIQTVDWEPESTALGA